MTASETENNRHGTARMHHKEELTSVEAFLIDSANSEADRRYPL